MIDNAGPAHLVVDETDARAACGSTDRPLIVLRHYALHWRPLGREVCRECVDRVTSLLLLATKLDDDP